MFLNVIPLQEKLHIALKISAVTYEIIVYTNVKISSLISPTANVTIRKIAKKVAATNQGHLSIFCRTIDNIMTANGIAKNNSNKSILYHIPSSRKSTRWMFFN